MVFINFVKIPLFFLHLTFLDKMCGYMYEMIGKSGKLIATEIEYTDLWSQGRTQISKLDKGTPQIPVMGERTLMIFIIQNC